MPVSVTVTRASLCGLAVYRNRLAGEASGHPDALPEALRLYAQSAISVKLRSLWEGKNCVKSEQPELSRSIMEASLVAVLP